MPKWTPWRAARLEPPPWSPYQDRCPQARAAADTATGEGGDWGGGMGTAGRGGGGLRGRDGDCGGGTQHCAAPRETQGEAGKPQCLSRKTRAGLGPEKPRKSRPRSTGGRGQHEGGRGPCCRVPVPGLVLGSPGGGGLPCRWADSLVHVSCHQRSGVGGWFLWTCPPSPAWTSAQEGSFPLQAPSPWGAASRPGVSGGPAALPGHSSLPASSAVHSRADILLPICSLLCLFLSWLSTRTGK